MPPRLRLLDAIRQSRTHLQSSVRPFSQTACSPAIRGPSDPSTRRASATSQLMGLESPTTPSSSQAERDPTGAAQRIWSALAREQAREGPQQSAEEALSAKASADDFMAQMPRKFNMGDVYAPHDLSPVEMRKWRSVTAVGRDLVDLLGLRPADMYRNFSFISEYMTTQGRIRPASQTGLRPVNQRKVAKAIRRAIGLGLHPSVHRHPELLKRERRATGTQVAPTGKIGNYI